MLLREQFEVYKGTNISVVLEEATKQLVKRVVDFQGTGSGWVIDK